MAKLINTVRVHASQHVIGIAFVVLAMGLGLTLWDARPTLTILGTLVFGAAMTFLVTHYYYTLAAAELANEARDLRRGTNIILKGLQKAGYITGR